MESTLRTLNDDGTYSVEVSGTWGTEKFSATVYATVTHDRDNLNDDGDPAWCAELSRVEMHSGNCESLPQVAVDYALSVIETNDPGVS